MIKSPLNFNSPKTYKSKSSVVKKITYHHEVHTTEKKEKVKIK